MITFAVYKPDLSPIEWIYAVTFAKPLGNFSGLGIYTTQKLEFSNQGKFYHTSFSIAIGVHPTIIRINIFITQ